MSLETLLPLLLQYKYIIMVPLISVVQPVLGVAVGILGRLDLIDIPIAYAILVGGALVGDVVWYVLGYKYGERFLAKFGRYVGLSPVHVHVAKVLFNTHHAPILVISKLVNGLGISIAVLFAAGMSRIPFGRFLLFNAIGEVTWSALLIMVGYFFSTIYVEITDELGRWSLVLLGGFIVTAIFIAGTIIQRRFEAYVSEQGQKNVPAE